MKTTTSIDAPAKTTLRRLLLSGLSVVAAAAALPVLAATSTEPKTHTLFMGTNLSVERDNAVHPVEDVVGGALVVTVKGKRVSIPMKPGPVSMKVDRALKLTERSATITNLKGDRRYTPANDPNRRFVADVSASMAGAAEVTMASGGLVVAQLDKGLGGGGGPNAMAGPNATAARSVSDMNAKVQALNSFNNSAGDHVGKLEDNLANELFDAVEITFEVSSEQPLSKPYVLVMARFSEKGSKASELQQWIYAEPLDPVDRAPRKVRIFQGGFPQGFELKDYQVHLYNQGEEIATTVSPKRVELTRDQAFEYVKIEYLGAHKAATLPAVPAMGRLPGDLRARLAKGEFGRTYFVKVTKDGSATGVFTDAAGSRTANDPYLDSLVKNLRFKPALEKGKPVDAVTPLNLSELPF